MIEQVGKKGFVVLSSIDVIKKKNSSAFIDQILDDGQVIMLRVTAFLFTEIVIENAHDIIERLLVIGAATNHQVCHQSNEAAFVINGSFSVWDSCYVSIKLVVEGRFCIVMGGAAGGGGGRRRA